MSGGQAGLWATLCRRGVSCGKGGEASRRSGVGWEDRGSRLRLAVGGEQPERSGAVQRSTGGRRDAAEQSRTGTLRASVSGVSKGKGKGKG